MVRAVDLNYANEGLLRSRLVFFVFEIYGPTAYDRQYIYSGSANPLSFASRRLSSLTPTVERNAQKISLLLSSSYSATVQYPRPIFRDALLSMVGRLPDWVKIDGF